MSLSPHIKSDAQQQYTLWQHIAVAGGIVATGLLLYEIAGGWPPTSWRLLALTLLQFPVVLSSQGGSAFFLLLVLLLQSLLLAGAWALLLGIAYRHALILSSIFQPEKASRQPANNKQAEKKQDILATRLVDLTQQRTKRQEPPPVPVKATYRSAQPQKQPPMPQPSRTQPLPKSAVTNKPQPSLAGPANALQVAHQPLREVLASGSQQARSGPLGSSIAGGSQRPVSRPLASEMATGVRHPTGSPFGTGPLPEAQQAQHAISNPFMEKPPFARPATSGPLFGPLPAQQPASRLSNPFSEPGMQESPQSLQQSPARLSNPFSEPGVQETVQPALFKQRQPEKPLSSVKGVPSSAHRGLPLESPFEKKSPEAQIESIELDNPFIEEEDEQSDWLLDQPRMDKKVTQKLPAEEETLPYVREMPLEAHEQRPARKKFHSPAVVPPELQKTRELNTIPEIYRGIENRLPFGMKLTSELSGEEPGTGMKVQSEQAPEKSGEEPPIFGDEWSASVALPDQPPEPSFPVGALAGEIVQIETPPVENVALKPVREPETTKEDLRTPQPPAPQETQPLKKFTGYSVPQESTDDFFSDFAKLATAPLPPVNTPLTAMARAVPRAPVLPEAVPQLLVGAATHPGIKRAHKPNEDSYLSLTATRTLQNGKSVSAGLFLVADGMGGHNNGSFASTFICETIRTHFAEAISDGRKSGEELQLLLIETIKLANRQLCQKNEKSGALCGTTLTGVLIVETSSIDKSFATHYAYIVNVGDSRTYCYEVTHGFHRITQDHSVVEQLIQKGMLKPEERYTDQRRNQIYRCLGERPDMDVDVFEHPLKSGGRLLICSDGLWEMVYDNKLADILLIPTLHPEACAQMLLQAAMVGGGKDNITALVVQVP